MMVLDASILIAHLDGKDPHHEEASRLLIASAGEPLAASPITLAEVLVGPVRSGLMDRAMAALRELDVARIDLGEDAPQRLAELRASTGLKLPDCCVLLTAEQVQGAIATGDARMAAAAHRLGLSVKLASIGEETS